MYSETSKRLQKDRTSGLEQDLKKDRSQDRILQASEHFQTIARGLAAFCIFGHQRPISAQTEDFKNNNQMSMSGDIFKLGLGANSPVNMLLVSASPPMGFWWISMGIWMRTDAGTWAERYPWPDWNQLSQNA